MLSFSRRWFSVLPVAAALSACTTSSPAPDETQLATAKKTDLEVQGFAAVVEAPDTVVIDVRTAKEYAQGHLANAMNVDVQSSGFRDALGKLDKDATYAIYCQSGNRSKTALTEMTAAGFRDVVHLAGGIAAWQSAGLPIVT